MGAEQSSSLGPRTCMDLRDGLEVDSVLISSVGNPYDLFVLAVGVGDGYAYLTCGNIGNIS